MLHLFLTNFKSQQPTMLVSVVSLLYRQFWHIYEIYYENISDRCKATSVVTIEIILPVVKFWN